MKHSLLLLLGLLLAPIFKLDAQETDSTYKYYWVAFTDKAGSPYQLDQPEAFLSERSVARRKKWNIPVTEQDFPPNPRYLDSLKELGAAIHHRSRWLNAATILIPEEKTIEVADLPFVEKVEYVGFPYEERERRKPNIRIDTLLSKQLEGQPYGYATRQIQLLNGDSLHQMGYTGEGIWLAVLDGGFIGVGESPFFDSLQAAGRLLLARDFVDGDLDVFESSTHGTRVLSTMGANVPGVMVGTAPGATYACIKTEDTRGEYRIEECHWVAGLEYADSLGADVVNSSLGYTTFNDRQMNYQFKDLDGKTSVASQAADIAFGKGMIVVNSAGNEGNSSWKHIGAPADARLALSVGAIDFSGERASFSSLGPTADERIKPDVAAPGAWVTVADPFAFQVSIGSGTSFASPILAGLVACLWEAFPEKSNAEIVDAIKKSASRAGSPDVELGYGIPNFGKAYRLLMDEMAVEPPVVLPAGQLEEK
ncbi:MAG: S8 family serine peptidase [Lewinellaceae bacterium]|nr:S8 family serine peptidase [Phaeodactylibacter sp.]MCB9040701.1 S8 family serine peptidase [Lewinellaceae bacterium]